MKKSLEYINGEIRRLRALIDEKTALKRVLQEKKIDLGGNKGFHSGNLHPFYGKDKERFCKAMTHKGATEEVAQIIYELNINGQQIHRAKMKLQKYFFLKKFHGVLDTLSSETRTFYESLKSNVDTYNDFEYHSFVLELMEHNLIYLENDEWGELVKKVEYR